MHICVSVRPNNSSSIAVWASPELQPPQLAIDSVTSIHPHRLSFEFRWNDADESKTTEHTIAEAPQRPRDVCRNG